ncbi:unnamed protein product [Protopolystoma xenopodis]|uniref:Uncharacterized protein n=1 Tax=Protopolystoma xenopodis TaxID=117903 RepID=A0A448WZY0_9PLAT|nr:unnamed protein product [Protopolystoma xenopodis]
MPGRQTETAVTGVAGFTRIIEAAPPGWATTCRAPALAFIEEPIEWPSVTPDSETTEAVAPATRRTVGNW